MAVSHGYSKVTTSGSVFNYDTGDTFNSYKGEPTTNLLAYPEVFTSWGVSSIVIRPNRVIAPDGTLSAYSMYSTSDVYPAISTTITPPNTSPYRGSIWMRSNTASNQTINFNLFRASPWGLAEQTDITVTPTWARYNVSMTALDTTTHVPWLGRHISSGASIDISIWKAQVENKSHVTPFVVGTRSNTQGLLDIANNTSNINLINMSYDANAMMYFDGTDDYAITTNSMPAMSNWTAEVVVNLTSYTAAQKIILDVNLGIRLETSNGYFNSHFGNGSGWVYTSLPSTFTYTPNKYYHVVITVESGATAKMYIDGVLNTSTSIGSGTTPTVPLYIGRFTGATGYEMTGYLPVTKIYNRPLTAGEVLNNFNHYKTRFNIT